MKIAFLCPDALSTKIFSQSFSEFFSKQKDVDFYTLSPVSSHEDYDYLNKVNSTHIPIKLTRFLNIFSDIFFMFNLYSITKKHNFDYVFTFTTKPNLLGPLPAYFAGASVFICVRGLGRLFNNPNSFAARFLKIGYYISSYFANKVWVTNDLDYNHLKNSKIPVKKFIKTKNAINLNEFKQSNVSLDSISLFRNTYGIQEDDFVVLLVGRLIWSKGIREFVEASSILSAKHPDIKFLLVAPQEKGSPDSVPLNYISDWNNCSQNNIWIDGLSNIKLAYVVSSLSVLPSYYSEGGYPRALLEAMSFGLPIIGGDTELCRGPVYEGVNGYLTPVKDSIALANKVQLIYENSKLYSNLSKGSLKIIKTDFDDNNVVRHIVSYLR
ncbi:glycosyltransferase [Alphaproteobacteria bacterium]|nr:glycosyltransferase [Alphaproteobacteria bacterium]